MSIRRSPRNVEKLRRLRQQDAKFRKQLLLRNLNIESLEDRRMMAGPQLAGILPDDGHLLQPNETLNVAPLDLTFRFDETQIIDQGTLAGIQVWRSGFDGKFTSASAQSDFGTNRAVELTFNAKALGSTENGIRLSVTKADFGGLGLPTVAVSGRNIAIQLNTNAGHHSTAQDLVSAITASPLASQLITASVTSGSATTDITTAATTNYSPLTLTGANAASGTTEIVDTATGNAARLKFTATTAGAAGNGTQVVLTRSNLVAGAAPTVSVNAATKTVTVTLNNTAGSKSRASDLITAINNNAAASALVSVALIGGTSATDVATPLTTNRTVTLSGSNDVMISAGYEGIGATPREVIYRFKESLPDDRYHIDIFGAGTAALKNDKGEVFNSGVNFQQEFRLDLGAQVVAVVPQPVDRNGNTLSQRRNQIDVYFNNDDLNLASATNPAYYQLVFTKDTVQNTDDAVFLPLSVAYDAALDKATLTFAANLDQLPTGPGTYRLRVGTAEATPAAPLQFRPIASKTSDFNTGGAVTLKFDAVNPGEAGGDIALIVTKANLGSGVQPTISVFDKRINIVLNNTAGSHTTAQQLVNALNNMPASAALLLTSIASGSASTDITAPNITYSPVSLAFTQGLGSSFGTALDVGTLTQSVIYSSAIDPENYSLAFPGSLDEPSHRDINVPGENSVSPAIQDITAGISVVYYNFRSDYGYDPSSGNAFLNIITENQKQRAREAFEQISRVSGVQFIETLNQGVTVATGDVRAILGCPPTGPGVPLSASGPIHVQGASPIVCGIPDTRSAIVLDNSEGWDDAYGGTWFQRVYHEILRTLGLGSSYDLPPGNLGGQDGPQLTTTPLANVNSTPTNTSGLQFDNTIEPSFPGAGDIVNLQYAYRPESKDIDMYKFNVDKTGLFSAETIAERRVNSSLLNTVLRLYQEVDVRDASGVPTGVKVKQLVSQNDDYFSNDSFIQLSLEPGVYWIGVSASGNASYDPTVEDSGMGGTSQGEYDLRLNFRPNVTSSLTDATGVAFDGDGDGRPGGVYNYWFRAQTPANTLFVDKAAASNGPGTLASPYNNIASAFAAALPGQIVRIEGNNGADGVASTLADNLPYEIGFNQLGTPLPDGPTMEVPKGVTVMVDAGAIFKMRRAEIGVGSASPSVDRSGSALQILGTTQQSVYFTSYDDATIGLDTNPDTTLPIAGAWGGLSFRRDIDRADLTRFDYEGQGIFLNYVNHADIRYGGGTVIVDSVSQPVSPINMVDSRPTISFNIITFGADAAMSASPNSFEETNFNAPAFQRVPFTLDYVRIGPSIRGNRLADDQGNSNSINGLAIRASTPAGNALRPLTVSARFDDFDIVHVIPENLIIQGTPGGPLLEITPPALNLVTVSRVAGGGTLSAGTYNYKMTFIDAQGNETPASTATVSRTVGNGDQIVLGSLLTPPSGFIGRRIYRSGDTTGNPSGSPYTLIAQINATDLVYTDRGGNLSAVLDERFTGLRARLDARLAIDPAMVVKLEGASISTHMGGQLIAEGVQGLETVFTSLSDDRYGAGGTFLTKKDGVQNTVPDAADPNAPQVGSWAGLVFGPYSSGSIDHAVIAFGGGLTRVEGTFTGMNAVEIHQSDVRIANSIFENNQNGLGGQAPSGRFGRGFNEESTIFVRGAQPIIVNNILRENLGPSISINVNSLDSSFVTDIGRTTGKIDRVPGYSNNQGPLVRGNRMVANQVNGMVVRGETLTTESVWDDTDIVHVLLDTVYVSDFHTYGGLRLESSPTESLVIKLLNQDPQNNNPNIPNNAGFSVNGRPLEITDRIGGIIQVLGQPGYPVVATSLYDGTVGAGYAPDGTPQTTTLGRLLNSNNLLPTGPEVNNGTLIDNDVPTNTVGHFEVRPGPGGSVQPGGASGATVQGNSQLFINQNFIFQFTNFIDTGSNGGAINLASTTITQAPTLISPDLVVSTGTFQGLNGPVNWRVETRMDNGVAIIYNTLQLSSTAPLGNIRFINYLDEDIQLPSDDLLYRTGTPGAPDFRVYTLDGPQRVGFSQGGIYVPGPGLVNATYTGWAADRYSLLLNNIQGAGVNYSIPGNIVVANLPQFNDPQLGLVNGLADVTTAFAWNVLPAATNATMTSFLELVAQNPAITNQPGDWSGITIGSNAHDRNVASMLETEPTVTAGKGLNGTPNTAQFLGQLAPTTKGGDESRRLGLTVQGAIDIPGDVDVYSFTADAGTEVWLDIDRTTTSLDTVLELLDANGNVLAQSDDSGTEQAGLRTIYKSGTTVAGPLVKSTNGKDFWTTNPRDAGMRVVLPGPQGTTSTYHVRVGSSNLTAADRKANPNAVADVSKGLTSGVYQLQIRLQEVDEIGGVSIQYADIRYANNGITVLGQPAHSPLLGEAAEITSAATINRDTNDTFATAQPIGNLLTSDRGAISVSGTLANYDDVDWYRLDVNYQELETAILGNIGAIFDMDYADGISRPDTNLSIFDSTGRLIITSTNSNVADDRPGPLQGSNLTDLTRGSVGALDPYIGTVNLPTGTNGTGPRLSTGPYFLAISSNQRQPIAALDQFTTRLPANPLTRVEPINSTIRIVEDHIEKASDLFDHGTLPYDVAPYSTATPATITNLFDTSSVVPYTLGDIPLFVSIDNGLGPNRSTLAMIDPFTGQLKTIVNNNDPAASYAFDVGDIAMRADGRLYAFSIDNETPTTGPTDAGSGNLLNIDTGTGVATVVTQNGLGGTRGIVTYEDDPANPGTPIVSHKLANGTSVGWGVQFNGTSFVPNSSTFRNGVQQIAAGEQLLAIGNRGDGVAGNNLNNGVNLKRNLLYWFTDNQNSSTALGVAQPNPGVGRIAGAGTDATELGAVLTGAQITPPAATTVLSTAKNAATTNINDQLSFDLNDGVSTTTFEFDAGPEVVQKINLASATTIRDGNYFELDPDPTVADDETIFQFDTGPVINVRSGSTGIGIGQTISVNGVNGVTETFEFFNSTSKVPIQNPNNIPVDLAGNATAVGVAGRIAAAINGANQLGVTASAVGNRVTLVNERTVALTAGLGGAVIVEGDVGRASILQAVPGSTTGLAGTQFSFATPGQIATFEFVNNPALAPGSKLANGNYAIPFAPTFTTDVMARQMNSAIVAAGSAGVSGVPLTTQLVTRNVPGTATPDVNYGRLVVNGQLLNYLTGSSPILDLTSIKPVVQIPVEENYDNQLIGTAVGYMFSGNLTQPLGTALPQTLITHQVGVVQSKSTFAASYEYDPARGANFVTDRINFPPLAGFTAAKDADFNGVPVWTATTSTYGVAPGHVSVPFRADDLAPNRVINNLQNQPTNVIGVAQRMADAVNSATIPGVTAFVVGSSMFINDATGGVTLPSIGAPLVGGGQGPGGSITGMASVGDNIYAVSDQGGLYQLTVDLTRLTVATKYIGTSAADLQGIQFSGLSAGPQGTEGNRYSNMLFATDTQGRLYAFNTSGVLQPIFVNGQTSVLISVDPANNSSYNPAVSSGTTDIPNVDFAAGGIQGLAFSTIQDNLFHITPLVPRQVAATAMDVRVGAATAVGQLITVNERQGDIGHSRLSTYDTTRFGRLDPNVNCTARLLSPPEDFPECGLQSYSFGQGNVNGVARTYDFPGGAKGTIVSNEFSLKGYTAADQPMLYFTYFLATEDANTIGNNQNYDSLRVFVAGDDGNWVRIAHNDDGLPDRNMFDSTGTWRQARVSLAAFAGQANLRLRYEFDTSGDADVGVPETNGDELRAIAGSQLRDGNTFRIDNQTFEFDMGYTLAPPSGGAVRDGEAFTVSDGTRQVTFEFDSNNSLTNGANVRILLDARQTAADIANLIAAAINLNGPAGVTPRLVGNRLNLQGATSVVQQLAPGETRLGIVLDGQPGVTPGNVAVPIHASMTRAEVGTAIDAALEPVFHNQSIVTGIGSQYLDGDSFQLNDGSNTATFEFDSGFVLTLANGLSIQDGANIRLFDSQGNAVTFEFDKDGIVAPGNIAVSISNVMPLTSVTSALRNAIANAPQSNAMGLAPLILTGSRLQIAANNDVHIKINSTVITSTGQPGVNGAVQFTVPGALGIQVPAAGGSFIVDGEQFTISDGVTTVTFEMDSDNVTSPGTQPVTFTATDSASQIADSIVLAVQFSGISGLNTTRINATDIDLGTNSVHTLDVSRGTFIALGRAGAVLDGEQFTLSDGIKTVTFEMDEDGTVTPGNVAISFVVTQDPDLIAQDIADAITAAGLSTVAPVTAPFGTLLLGETAATIVNTAGLSQIQRTGVAGGNVTAIPFSPSSTFTGKQMAQAIATAINTTGLGVNAVAEVASQRRVTLTGNTVTMTLLQGGPPLSFVAPVDIVKSDGDLIHIIGHTVTDQGPLGLQTTPLPGDMISAPLTIPVGINSNRTGQNNRFEGFYLDDIVIGFAERGEMVTGATANTNFTVPTAQDTSQSLVGPYQLEIRRSSEYTAGTASPVGTNPLLRSFDTNARLTDGVSIVAHAGSNYADAQTFTLTDGNRVVTFEFDDQSILTGEKGYGVAPGNFAIPFNPTDVDWQIATKIRDAINTPAVRAALPSASAALSDGTDGVFLNNPSTSNLVNLYGQVTLGEQAVDVTETMKSNDTIATATDSGIVGMASPAYVATGEIGDNPAFPLQRGRDVDIYKVFLNAGETLRIDVDAAEIGSTIDAVLAVFTSTGVQLAISDNAAAVGENATLDPYIDFTPTVAGNYYIGVSGRTTTALYNPNFEGSGGNGSTGFYRLGLTFGSPSPADFVQYNEIGDTNRVRDQGQIILNGNKISKSAGWGIFVDADVRDAGTNSPHQGPVINTPQLNSQNLVTSVVVQNNLISDSKLGGIRFSGQTNAAGVPVAPVPFGRIINNTIVGIGGTLIPGTATDIGIRVDENASPTLLNNIIANTNTGITVDASSSTTVVGGTLYQGNITANTGVTSEAFPINLAITDPLFVNAAQGNYYLAAKSQAIDSSVDSLQDRATMVTVKSPLGIPPSPILAPDRDVNGLLRVDDPTSQPPSGLGQNIFKDRGAIDRSDFAGSTAILISPSAPNGSATAQFTGATLTEFSIQINDGSTPSDPVNGIGVDDATVSKSKVFLLKNNELLREGIDYVFRFDSINNVIRLTPLAGVWETNKTYVLDLVNRDQFTFAVPNGDQLTDGQTFQVSDATRTATFEFDSGYVLQVPATGVTDGNRLILRNGAAPAITFEFDRNSTVAPGSIAIPFTTTSTPNDIANAIVTAVSAVTSLGFTPQNIGNGKVYLGGTANNLVDVSNSPLTIIGTAGVTTAGAIAIPFIPGNVPTNLTQPAQTDNQIVTAIVNAIQSSGLTNVRATPRIYTVQGVEVVEAVIRGAVAFTGFTSTFTQAIRDLAGNELKANNAAGSTTFTITLGSGVDYGDAPSTYPVAGSNAAGHAIKTGFYLGTSIDAEPIGIPTADASGDDLNSAVDDEDGVVFNTAVTIGGTATVTVTASAAGVLDAFLDFNRDGDWLDANEKIFSQKALVAGANTLTFSVPSGASLGTSFARFRFSSLGGLGPDGPAVDGEVEDYQVTVSGPPWQNAANRFDVSGDTFVSSIDALVLINFLNSYGSGGSLLLPVPPVYNIPGGGTIVPTPVNNLAHYFDVNGDGFAAPNDVLAIINRLNAPSPEGEALRGTGEGEGETAPAVAGSASVMATLNNTFVALPMAATTSNVTIVSAGSLLDAGLASFSTDGLNNQSDLQGSSYAVANRSTVSKPVEFAFQLGTPVSTSTEIEDTIHGNLSRIADHKMLALDDVLEEIAAGRKTKSADVDSHDDFFASMA